MIRLYLGQMTPEAVFAAADDPNPRPNRGGCARRISSPPNLALQRRTKTRPRACFGLPPRTAQGFTERAAANAELKALGANP